MFNTILVRLLQSIGVMLVMSIIVFIGVNLVGNPIDMMMPPTATPAEVAEAIKRFGLDLPIHQQYLMFLKNAIHGDLGNSFITGRPALQLIAARFPATFELAFTALVIAVVLGLPLGIAAGYLEKTFFSRSIMVGSILGFSFPTFWMGLVLIMLFSVHLGWLPAGGRGETASFLGIETSLLTKDGLIHLLLPALTLSFFKISLVIRLAASGTREVIHLDYVKFAHAKGLSKTRVLFVHVMKNIMIPVITVLGLEFGGLLAFSLVTESVFAWPGMGKLLIDAIQQLDRPIVVAYLLLIVLIFVLINFLVDFMYVVLDPRVRVSARN